MADKILVIFPHPDDEAFGVSGTIASHIDKGDQVTYICLTLGEMGRNMGNPLFTNREELPHIRKVELKEACRRLGIQDLRQFGLRDKTVEFEDQKLLAGRILEVIIELNPVKIITFYPGYSVHPDHDACGSAVIRAVKMIPEQKRPTIHCVAFANNCEEELGQPDVIHDVHQYLDKKIDVMRAHRSQTENFLKNVTKNLKKNDQATYQRFATERFWTYQFK